MKKLVERPIVVSDLAESLKSECKDLWAILQLIDGPTPVSISHRHPITDNLFDTIDAIERIADALISGKQSSFGEDSNKSHAH